VSELGRRLGPLLAVVVGAVLLAWLGTREGPPLPAGSARSTAPDGARALFLWVDSLGRRAERLESLGRLGAQGQPGAVFVLSPAVPLGAADRQALDAVPAAGGTLVLAGPTSAYAGYLEALGLEASTGTFVRQARPPGESGPAVRVDTWERLTGEGATPLLVAPDGEAVAVRTPYRAGQVVVVTGVRPFTNAGLRDEDAARFVFRVVDGAVPAGATAVFDESHYLELTPAGEPVQTFGSLLRETGPGRAALYAVALTFGFLLLAGRRLGPPIPPVGATASGRTMFEQVQALAGLYRRAGQLPALRRHFAARYGRELAAGKLPPAQRAAAEEALGRIEVAPSEAALVGAVGRFERLTSQAGGPSSAPGRGTLTPA
jgi:hypothetical protein